MVSVKRKCYKTRGNWCENLLKNQDNFNGYFLNSTLVTDEGESRSSSFAVISGSSKIAGRKGRKGRG